MALRIHGQLQVAAAGTYETLFVCTYESFVCSGIWVSNPAAASFSIRVVPSFEATPGAYNNIYALEPMVAGTTYRVPAGITLELDDRIMVTDNVGGTVFTLFGDGQGEE